MTDRLVIALAQLDGRRSGGQRGPSSGRSRDDARGARRRPGGLPSELVPSPAIRRRTSCCGRRSSTRPAAVQSCRRERRGGPGVGRTLLARRRPPAQRRVADRRRLASTRFNHDLPNYGVFDEKRVFAPARRRDRCFPRHTPRPADLRRHLVPDVSVLQARGRAAARAQRLALEVEKFDQRLELVLPRDRKRPAARLRQPGRRTGRAGLRRRLLRA